MSDAANFLRDKNMLRTVDVGRWCLDNGLDFAGIFCAFAGLREGPLGGGLLPYLDASNTRISDFSAIQQILGQYPALLAPLVQQANNAVARNLLTGDLQDYEIVTASDLQDRVPIPVEKWDGRYLLVNSDVMARIVAFCIPLVPPREPEAVDCDNVARIIWGETAKLNYQGAQLACGLAWMVLESPYTGHIACVAVCTDGVYWIEENGIMYPFNTDMIGDTPIKNIVRITF